ncbi:MAG: NAD-glutamate dehydrogenase, partial [Geopsychrobacter sp.]|nr:NAD-glutamate dehydrogenase [Geopsychrobacter sp.]
QGFALLTEMEGTFCHDVLANNYLQTLSISLDEIRCRKDVEPHLDLMDRLSRSGLLDRRDEFLPSRKEVALRQPARLLRPELSVLLAYSKMSLFRNLLEEGLPKGTLIDDLLYRYFPQQARDRYLKMLKKHPLANEITATVMTNHVVDRAGSRFCLGIVRLTGASQARVAHTYLQVDQLMDAEGLRQEIFALDNRLPAAEQYQILLEIEQLLADFTLFTLSQEMMLPTDERSEHQFATLLDDYIEALPSALPSARWQACQERGQQLITNGISPESAARIAILSQMTDFLPLVRLVNETKLEMTPLVTLSNEVLNKLSIDMIISGVETMTVHDSWDRKAREALLGSLHNVFFQIVQKIALEGAGESRRFFRKRIAKYRSYRELCDKLSREEITNFHPYSVLLRALESLLNS